MLDSLRRLLDRRERVVVGLMSGTSLDGVDAAVVRLGGSGRGLSLETLGTSTVPYDAGLRDVLLASVEAGTSNVRDLALLDVALAQRFADAAESAVAAASLRLEDIDLVGSHGQTVQHLPDATPLGGARVRATLQLGNAAALAMRLGVPVVSGFRSADVALGGQGAPLAPYLDDVLFASVTETRALLNLGGIANVSILPAGAPPGSTYGFDTGPANVVIDAIALRRLGVPCDADGAGASAGHADTALVDRLLADPWFATPPPRSTGREAFGAAFVDRLIAEGPADTADLLATATTLTVRSVTDALRRFGPAQVDRLIAAGGGVHNRAVMAGLAAALAPVPVETTAAYGLDPDAKEAVLFAVLAHEWANGVPTSMPAVTGASRPALLGSLTMP